MRSAKLGKPESTGIRVGTIALSLALLGLGGAICVTRAQGHDVNGTRVILVQDSTEKSSKSATDDSKDKAKDKEKQSAVERQLRQELDSLLQQREQLDNRIAEIRKSLGDKSWEGDKNRLPQDFFGAAPFVQGWPNNGQLTPEELKQLEEARQRAAEAMRQAQKAMGDAFANGNAGRVFALPNLPNLRVFTDPADPNGARGFVWRFDGNKWQWSQVNPRVVRPGQKLNPEAERAMRDFRDRMEKMMQEFTDQFLQKFGGMDDNQKAPKAKDDSTNPKDTEKDTSPDKSKKDKDTSSPPPVKSARIII